MKYTKELHDLIRQYATTHYGFVITQEHATALLDEIDRLHEAERWIPADLFTPPLDEVGIDSTKVSKLVNVIRLLRAYENPENKHDKGYLTKDGWNNESGNRIRVTYWQPIQPLPTPPEGE